MQKRSVNPIIGMDLAVDPALSHAARNQLRHLAAKIDYQQLLVQAHFGATLSNKAMKNPSVPVRRGVNCSV